MYWFRMEQSLGRNSIVGTTIKQPQYLPKHLVADEKHSWILGNKVHVATTSASGCILGASIAEDTSEKGLAKAYAVFKKEAQYVHPGYTPETVNTDGWKGTQKAWKALFPSIVLICRFLHLFIKIRNRAKKNTRICFCKPPKNYGTAIGLKPKPPSPSV